MPFVKSKSVHVVDVVTVVCSLDLYLVLHYVNDAGWLEDWSLTHAPSHTHPHRQLRVKRASPLESFNLMDHLLRITVRLVF